MKKVILLFSAIVAVVMCGCHKPYEYMEPEITETSITQNSVSSVSFEIRVNFNGVKDMIVEVSQDKDFKEVQRHNMKQNSEWRGALTLSDLKFGTKYYYRFVVSNPNFTITSEEKSFKIDEAYMYYGDGDFATRWGLTNGGTDEWAVMFPSSLLSSYQGASITKVRAYVAETGNYKLNIYSGGTSSPTTLQKKQSFTVSSTGWQTININSLSIDVSTPLWVSIATSSAYDAGKYPKGSGKGVNNKNARWERPNEGSWRDVYNANENRDLTWLIQVYIKKTNGEKGLEIELPLNTIEQDDENCVENSCVSVRSFD